jgi:branched-chain amino acid transport system ATP-binding protein
MKPLLETHDLVKRFGGLLVTNRCNLTIRPGEIHALIGPNGAGKTTLLRQLSGALAVDHGRIVFDGTEITRLPMDQRVQRGLAQTFQITNIFPSLTVLDNLALSVQATTGHSFRFWRPRRQETAIFERAAVVAAQIGLGAQVTTVAGALSHGEQRQLEIGLALACGARLLLLDEPLAGMGLEESAKVVALLRTINQSATILLVEHDMDAVFQLADRISVLVYGEIIATGTPAEIRENRAVQQAYLG